MVSMAASNVVYDTVLGMLRFMHSVSRAVCVEVEGCERALIWQLSRAFAMSDEIKAHGDLSDHK